MNKPIPDGLTRRTPPGILIAQALFIALIASCAGSPDPDSSTPGEAPGVPSAGPPNTPLLSPAETPPPSAEAQVLAPSPEPTDTEPPVAAGAATAADSSHVVQPGDTLLGLAQQYGVPMAAIQLRNQMGGSTVVRSGQTLSIPSSVPWPDSSPFWMVHHVAPGETLIAIARAYDVEPSRLQAVNSLDDADRLAVGENLVLPLSGPAPPGVVSPTAAPVPTSTPLPQPTAQSTAEPAAESPQAPQPTEPPEPTTPAGAPPDDLAAWPREIARLINEVRAQHGLPPLAYHQTLERAAQAHADDCAQRGWCGHTGSDGASIKTRILRAGYEGSGWAECWAQTQSPRRAVEVWMDEAPPNDPHRRTLLSTWLSEIGIGVADADWGTYIIANFGRP